MNHPLVSIVTPSFQQARYLKTTMESVLNQSYSPIEYIVIDGGSSDGSQEIIQEFSSKLAYWQSEKDSGPAQAINRGWQHATGEILAYLNSDDLLLTNTVEEVALAFAQNPSVDVIYGDSDLIDAEGKRVGEFASKDFDLTRIFSTWENPVRQPSTFFRRSLFLRFGPLNEMFRFCFDFEYWLRISAEAVFLHVPRVWSRIRLHSEAITFRLEDLQASELVLLFENYRNSEIFRKSGVKEDVSRSSVYLAAAQHYEKAGKRMKALKAFREYCRNAFSSPVSVYRLSRYIARLLVRS